KGLVGTIKAAKEMVELQQTEVWDALEEVIKEHPVLLNRAPTLHRLGIQAFEPLLVEGKAIKIHPLVCTAFNADFDGDQMAVHVPLSPKAQVESQVLMLASNNILSPANGKPLAVPSQDLVLGCYYLTKEKKGAKGEGKIFGSFDEVVLALQAKEVELLTPIRVRVSGKFIDLTKHFNDQDLMHAEIQDLNKKIVETTVGRVIFKMHMPDEIPFINGLLKKRALQELVNFAFVNFGNALTVQMLDDLKDLGFLYATKAGVSIGVDDMVIPSKKQDIVEGARKAVLEVERQRLDGAITHGERHNKIIDIWHRATENVSDEMFSEMARTERDRGEFNPIFMMADSGARGSKEQVRQLAGMRGLMSKPSGEVIETPVSQSDEITDELANSIQEAGIEQVKIRSGLTCETRRGICRRCYGRNLASGKMVEIGEAVGVIAAESIGEPGTQLTMRTFHVGGTASRVSEQSRHEATNPGKVIFSNVSTVTNKNGDLVVVNRNGKLIIVEDTPTKRSKKGSNEPLAPREKERYALVYGSTLKVHEGQHVDAGT